MSLKPSMVSKSGPQVERVPIDVVVQVGAPGPQVERQVIVKETVPAKGWEFVPEYGYDDNGIRMIVRIVAKPIA